MRHTVRSVPTPSLVWQQAFTLPSATRKEKTRQILDIGML